MARRRRHRRGAWARTTGGFDRRRVSALTFQDCVPQVNAMAAARGEVNIIVLCHGGPIAEPEWGCAFHPVAVPGLSSWIYGASSMERLPTEVAR